MAGLNGPYNLVSPPGHTTMGELLDACVAVTGSTAELRWTTPDIVLGEGIDPWTELPIWVPPDTDLHDTLHAGDTSRAGAAGLRCRPVTETVSDTWRWLRELGGVAPQRADRPVVGLDPEKEAKALALTLGEGEARVP